MAVNSTIPEALVIAQDDQTEIHVQPVVQSGRRHLDIRTWRRGAAGFSPSQVGVTIEGVHLKALQAGITELLHASDGGRTVARVVRDSDDGRRLRAEVEPFGMRYVARLGFWQRVRDSWKPLDDGLVLAADRLRPMHAALERFGTWAIEPDSGAGGLDRSLKNALHATLDRWPSPGADWLTIEPDRVTLHPKGIRITCMVTEQGDKHCLVVRQWKRDDTLWLPEPVSVSLTISDLDELLSALLRLSDRNRTDDERIEEVLECRSGSILRIVVEDDAARGVLRLFAQSKKGEALDPTFDQRVFMPAQYLHRFGRSLAQGWFLLAGWLSDTEREALQETASLSTEANVLAGPASSPAKGHVGIGEEAAAVANAVDLFKQPDRDVFAFGTESETPGFVLPEGPLIRVSVEGFHPPRALSLSADVVGKVITGLEDLNAARQRQKRVDPVLLCDRTDCAVYGRVGIETHPGRAELRVWTAPTKSESVNFEAIYLPDLIQGLRNALIDTGRSVPPSIDGPEVTAAPPKAFPTQGSPARFSRLAPFSPLQVPGPLAMVATALNPQALLSIPLGDVLLGQNTVSLSVQGPAEEPELHLRWETNLLELPLNDLENLLAELRNLYYDALRGRRGRVLSVGKYPVVQVSIHNQGAQLYCLLEQEVDGEVTCLAFPASEVPNFLAAVRSALTKL